MTRLDYPATSTTAVFLAFISGASFAKLIVAGRPFSSPAAIREALEEMANYNFVYMDMEETNMQWYDIQRKLGNLPPMPTPFKPPSFTPAKDKDSKPKDKARIDDKGEDELEELEDNLDLDDDCFLQYYRRKRLGDMREAAKVAKYG